MKISTIGKTEQSALSGPNSGVSRSGSSRWFGSSTLVGSILNFFNPGRVRNNGEEEDGPKVEQHIRNIKC